jgi:hypothetical protein
VGGWGVNIREQKGLGRKRIGRSGRAGRKAQYKGLERESIGRVGREPAVAECGE